MTANPWQREYDVAVRAVRDGSLLARDIRERLLDPAMVKADLSPVTIADFAVQALIAHRLAEAFSGDPLVAEEDAAALRTPAGRTTLESVCGALQRAAPELDVGRVLDTIDLGRGTPGGRFWTLDPVDGTQGLLRGDQYVVALALIVDGQVQIGVLGCPGLSSSAAPAEPGMIARAARGCGTFHASLAGRAFLPLRVSSCRDPRAARVLRSFETGHIDLHAFNAIVRAAGIESPPTLMDSQAKHVVIAAGRADLLIRIPAAASYRDKIWDQAAGSLLIEEAGGRVTDLRGSPLDFSTGRLLTRNEGVIASNGHLHAAVVDAARTVLSPSP